MEEQTFDSSKLHDFLKKNLSDFPQGDGALKIFKFRTGTSNPTFLLQKDGKDFVLRHKAPFQMYAGFHKVDVEHKIMSALKEASFPVPKMYLFCENKAIMGQEFYVMEYVKGRQFPDANLPGVPADQTKAIFEAAIRTLALLQSLDTDKLNLGGIGDKENVLKQRMDMLFEAYKQTERKSIPKAYRLMEWLRENKPNDGKKPVIHHEDFRISNILWHLEEDENTCFYLALVDERKLLDPQCIEFLKSFNAILGHLLTKSCYLLQPQALAVIDWEGACWGHPFEDLAFFCFPFHFPAALEFTPALKIGYYSEGIPSEEALLSLYCDLTGNSPPLPNWKFFMGLVFFRVIVNIQTVVSQVCDAGGNEFPVTIKSMSDMLEPLVEHAYTIVGLQ